MYLVFSHMLKSFGREDFETLWKLVKAKYGSTRPVEDLDLILWGDLKTMFLTICLKTESRGHPHGRIVGIKRFLMLFGITTVLIDVNAAQSKLVLLEKFNENYSKCLRMLYKVNAAEGVNVASEEVSTTESRSSSSTFSASLIWMEKVDWMSWKAVAGRGGVGKGGSCVLIPDLVVMAKVGASGSGVSLLLIAERNWEYCLRNFIRCWISIYPIPFV
ncbi:hypothetical protein Tco_1397646 [Tanacetum coccineum]